MASLTSTSGASNVPPNLRADLGDPGDNAARERLAVAGGFALLVAGILLLAVVLPAEYGLDPFGTGEKLGLTAMAQASAQPAATIISTDAASKLGTPQSGSYKIDSAQFTVAPKDGFEYKYRLEKGAGMLYSWKASGRLQYEFHGEPDGAGGDTFESYEKQEGDHESGSLVASFSGIHGWYWENPGSSPVTITLTSSGFYNSATEFRDKKRVEHQLKDLSGR
jgi:hypothetical protein